MVGVTLPERLNRRIKLPLRHTPEAIALSILDLLDARLEQAYSVLAQMPEDHEFSPYVSSLERQLFRGTAARKEDGHERV